MAKKIKDTKASMKRPRKAGKDIVPRLKMLNGQSFITMASTRNKAVFIALLWAFAPQDANKPFSLCFEIPDGEDPPGTMLVAIPIETKQAQVLYEKLPRRVPKFEMPPECPLEEVVEPDGTTGPDTPNQ